MLNKSPIFFRNIVSPLLKLNLSNFVQKITYFDKFFHQIHQSNVIKVEQVSLIIYFMDKKLNLYLILIALARQFFDQLHTKSNARNSCQ